MTEVCIFFYATSCGTYDQNNRTVAFLFVFNNSLENVLILKHDQGPYESSPIHCAHSHTDTGFENMNENNPV